jgi:hypothetical protein
VAKLVYIGGYGRSGSTLLEYLLTTSPEVVACGEVERHLRRFGRHKTCTCGRRLKECPVWGAFEHKSGKVTGWSHHQLTSALLTHIAGDYAVMVDSSKTAWGSTSMPFRLSRGLGDDFLLVHLVRDPRAVAWSTMRSLLRVGTRRDGRPKVGSTNSQRSSAGRSLLTALGWTIANLACEMFGWFYPQRYLRLRYEDLVRAPLLAVGQVLTDVSIDAPATLAQHAASSNRHQLYGNAMRFQILSPADLKEDAAWKTAMPKGYRLLVEAFTWPLRWRYGYGAIS